MSPLIRVALTQTCNAYSAMPCSIDGLPGLAKQMPAIAEANLNHHLELLEQAASMGVQAICFGELFTGPYFALHQDPMWIALAEDATNGPTVTALKAAAKRHAILIVAPIYEWDASSRTRFNTAVVIEKDGTILGSYRKCHIPEGENDAGSFHETFYYDRSDGKMDNGDKNISDNDFFPVFETSIGKLGVAICYDRHFPGVMKALSEGGAELVFSPAVTFGQKSRQMWEMEFAVDATRHNLFIGGSNRIGSEPPWNQEFFGASYFVGPNGRPSPIEAPKGLVVADLNLGELRGEDPSGWNFTRDLRPAIYKRDASPLPLPTPSLCLLSKRLHLRPLSLDDAADLFPAFHCAQTMQYWSCGPKQSVEEVREYMKWNVEGSDVQCFAVTTQESPCALGWVALIEKNSEEAEIGFILRPDARGKGYGKEAAQRVMQYGFASGLRRIVADVDPDNAPSIRCIEGLGMKREGHMRATWKTHIGVRDSLLYSKLASDPDQ